MADKISIKSNIKVFDIENEEGIVIAQLKLDTSDDSTMSRYMDLYDNILEIYEDVKNKFEEYGEIGDDTTPETVRKYLDTNTEAINKIVDETDKMFGDGFIRQLYSEHYAINPNFIPSIELLVDFYSQVMPIVKKTYSAATKKYSVKKGK